LIFKCHAFIGVFAIVNKEIDFTKLIKQFRELFLTTP
jgi:hypothetical protein